MKFIFPKQRALPLDERDPFSCEPCWNVKEKDFVYIQKENNLYPYSFIPKDSYLIFNGKMSFSIDGLKLIGNIKNYDR